jgi:hypothetical protein
MEGKERRFVVRRPLIVGLALAAAIAAVAGAANLRKRYNRWGATDNEVARRMPGDGLIAEADYESTRAITIDAPPQYVWPWLVQMGSGRGGAYTYDWIENLLGLDMHSADRIVPDWQHIEVGDRLPLGQKGEYMEVAEIDPERALVFRHRDGNWSWTFALAPVGDAQTRFVSRNRFSMRDVTIGERVAMVIVDPGAFIMERKMLLGIKERAEKLYGEKAGAGTRPAAVKAA